MRKALGQGIVWMLLAAMLFPGAVFAETPAAGFATHAEAASIIDVNSGRILYNQQGDKQMRIASLTKVMTAIVAIEQSDLSDRVKVSSAAAGKEGSSLYLKSGEEMSLENLLYGMMLRSGNDAATAIAEHVGGSVEGFAYLMNKKAEMLGMSRSHFANPSGLDAPDHYSTANDMAKLTAYALNNPIFREIVKTKQKKAPNPNESWDYIWNNKNKMLSIYPGADGVKTGYTKLSRRCLISSATRDGRQIAVVTLNDGNDWADHARALDYGFRQYSLVPIVVKGEVAEGTKLVVGADFSYPLTDNEKSQITKKVVLGDPYSLDYRFGELGRLDVMLDGKKIASLPLYETGSARISAPQMTSSFSFAESEPFAPTVNKFLLGLHLLVRALFSPGF